MFAIFGTCEDGRMEPKKQTTIRTAEHVADTVQEAVLSEKRRLRRLVGDRLRRHLLGEGVDPDVPLSALAPAEARRRRALRRRFKTEVLAGGVRPTVDALVEAAIVAELGGRGWLDGPVPVVDREMVPVSRWPGSGSGEQGAAWQGSVTARVATHLLERTVARCWEHSAPAVAALVDWRDRHPDLVHRAQDPRAWEEYDRLAAGVLTPGDVYRDALARVRLPETRNGAVTVQDGG